MGNLDIPYGRIYGRGSLRRSVAATKRSVRCILSCIMPGIAVDIIERILGSLDYMKRIKIALGIRTKFTNALSAFFVSATRDRPDGGDLFLN